MLENSKHKNRIAVFLLLVVYLVFNLSYSPFFVGLGYDQEIFQYIGMLLDKGQVPYTDVFDHKPPLIYVLNYLGFLITPNSTWGIFILLNCFGVLSVILIYKLSVKHTKNLWLSVLLGTLYICLFSSSVFMQGGNYTRQFTAYLTVIILYLVFSYKKTNFIKAFLGLIIGFIFFTQQNEILGGLILVAYYLYFETEFKLYSLKKIIVNGLLFLGGFMISVLAILALVYSWDNYNDFINQAYLFNFNSYIDKESILYKIAKICYVFALKILTNIPLLVATLIVGYFTISAFIKKKKIATPFIIIALAFVFQIISTSISGRAYEHYFLMFMPFIIGLLIFSIEIFNKKNLKYLYVIILLAIGIQYAQDVSFDKKENTLLANVFDKTTSVKELDGQFYSFDATYLRVNFKLNSLAPTKWIYTHYMDNKMLNQILEDLNKNETKFVLVKAIDIEEFDMLKLFLDRNYSTVINNEKHLLFERNQI